MRSIGGGALNLEGQGGDEALSLADFDLERGIGLKIEIQVKFAKRVRIGIAQSSFPAAKRDGTFLQVKMRIGRIGNLTGQREVARIGLRLDREIRQETAEAEKQASAVGTRSADSGGSGRKETVKDKESRVADLFVEGRTASDRLKLGPQLVEDTRAVDVRELVALQQGFKFAGGGIVRKDNHAALEFRAELVGYGGRRRRRKIHGTHVQYGGVRILSGNQSQRLPDIGSQQALAPHASEQDANGLQGLKTVPDDQHFEALLLVNHVRGALPPAQGRSAPLQGFRALRRANC